LHKPTRPGAVRFGVSAPRGRSSKRLVLSLILVGVIGVIGGRVGLAALGLGIHRHSPTAQLGLASRSTFVVRHTGLSHPRGRDEDEKPTVRRTAWRGLWTRPIWKGGGRHPVWRGCRHVYDPALSKFIFSRLQPSS
jgi:hypothetical protein